MIVVGGSAYGGWKTVSVTRSIENLAGTFSVTGTDRWPLQSVPRPFRRGDSVSVSVHGETVITGWIDDVRPSYSADDHQVTVAGRDATGDLVDCSPEPVPGEWHGRTVLQIAQDLVSPFGLKVAAKADVGAPFPDFRIQEGETVFETLDRLGRMRALLVTTDGKGTVVLTRGGTEQAPTALYLGGDRGNILRADGEFSDRDRFSLYRVKGQRKGSDTVYGKALAPVLATATDPGVRRYRPTTIIAEDQGDGVTFEERALWESTVRAGRARRVRYTLTGWSHASGVWQPNTLVTVDDPFAEVTGQMLIVEVSFSLDEQGGELTTLSVSDPAAFEQIALQKHKKKGKGRGGADYGLIGGDED